MLAFKQLKAALEWSHLSSHYCPKCRPPFEPPHDSRLHEEQRDEHKLVLMRIQRRECGFSVSSMILSVSPVVGGLMMYKVCILKITHKLALLVLKEHAFVCGK